MFSIGHLVNQVHEAVGEVQQASRDAPKPVAVMGTLLPAWHGWNGKVTADLRVLPASCNESDTTTFIPPVGRPRGAALKQILNLPMGQLIEGKHHLTKEADFAKLQEIMCVVEQYYSEVCKHAKEHVPLLISQLDERRTEHKAVYSTTLRGIKREVGYQDYDTRSTALALETDGFRSTLDPIIQTQSSSLLESYNHALQVKERYDVFMSQIGKKSGGTYIPAKIKHIYRALEKMFLLGQNPLTQATVLDMVRGLLEFDSMEKMQKALEYIFACDDRFREGRQGGAYFAAASDLSKVKVCRVKDRMAKPTSGGWADAMINFSFVDDVNEHVCEIQFAHERLVTDRKEGGAHHGYSIFRAAFEILECIQELPPSELSCDDKGNVDDRQQFQIEDLMREIALLKKQMRDESAKRDQEVANRDREISGLQQDVASLQEAARPHK